MWIIYAIIVVLCIVAYEIIYNVLKNKIQMKKILVTQDDIKVEFDKLKIKNTEDIEKIKTEYNKIHTQNIEDLEKIKMEYNELKKYTLNKIISQNDEILIIKNLTIAPVEKIILSVQKLTEQFCKEKIDIRYEIKNECGGLLFAIEEVEIELKNKIVDLEQKINNL